MIYKMAWHELLIWIVMLWALAATDLLAEGIKKPQLVQRRVVILDFVNSQKAPDYGYLEDYNADFF